MLKKIETEQARRESIDNGKNMYVYKVVDSEGIEITYTITVKARLGKIHIETQYTDENGDPGHSEFDDRASILWKTHNNNMDAYVNDLATNGDDKPQSVKQMFNGDRTEHKAYKADLKAKKKAEKETKLEEADKGIESVTIEDNPAYYKIKDGLTKEYAQGLVARLKNAVRTNNIIGNDNIPNAFNILTGKKQLSQEFKQYNSTDKIEFVKNAIEQFDKQLEAIEDKASVEETKPVETEPTPEEKQQIYNETKADERKLIISESDNNEDRARLALEKKKQAEKAIEDQLEPIVTALKKGVGNGITDRYVDSETGVEVDASALRGKEETKEGSSIRHERFSNNDKWYSQFFAQYKRQPTKADYLMVAEEMARGKGGWMPDSQEVRDAAGTFDNQSGAEAATQNAEILDYLHDMVQIYTELEEEFKAKQEKEKPVEKPVEENVSAESNAGNNSVEKGEINTPQQHYRIILNDAQKGVEIWFDSKVPNEIYNTLIENGYKLTRSKPKHFYSKQNNDKAMKLARDWGLGINAAEYDSNSEKPNQEYTGERYLTDFQSQIDKMLENLNLPFSGEITEAKIKVMASKVNAVINRQSSELRNIDDVDKEKLHNMSLKALQDVSKWAEDMRGRIKPQETTNVSVENKTEKPASPQTIDIKNGLNVIQELDNGVKFVSTAVIADNKAIGKRVSMFVPKKNYKKADYKDISGRRSLRENDNYVEFLQNATDAADVFIPYGYEPVQFTGELKTEAKPENVSAENKPDMNPDATEEYNLDNPKSKDMVTFTDGVDYISVHVIEYGYKNGLKKVLENAGYKFLGITDEKGRYIGTTKVLTRNAIAAANTLGYNGKFEIAYGDKKYTVKGEEKTAFEETKPEPKAPIEDNNDNPVEETKRFDKERAKKGLAGKLKKKNKGSEPQENDAIKIPKFDIDENELDSLLKDVNKIINRANANVAFDPELAVKMFKIGVIYIKKGFNTFADWSNIMLKGIPNGKPFLKATWNSIKGYKSDVLDEETLSAIVDYVGAELDDGKSIEQIKKDLADEYEDDLTAYIDSAYIYYKDYPSALDDIVVKSKDDTIKEGKQNVTNSQGLQGVSQGEISKGVQQNGEGKNTGDVRGAENRGNDTVLQGQSVGTVDKQPNSGRSNNDGENPSGESESSNGKGTGESDVVRAELTPAQKKNAKASETPGHNFTITDEQNIGKGGPKAKYKDNVVAIRLLKQLESENRQATPEEQKVLAKYVGWGGLADAFNTYGMGSEAWKKEQQELKELLTEEEYNEARRSTTNAHYTSPAVIKNIWKIIERLGFKNGRVLEPSMGIGNFFGLMPENMRSKSVLNGVELDSITGRIAKQLYQKANIDVMGYQDTKYPDGYFDLVISNVPFGNYKINDPKYNKFKFNIHNYFFAKSIDQVRPGGLVCFITSTGTMDSGQDSERLRELLKGKADLVGAVRLPNTSFKENAGTEVTTDLIILRKLDSDGEHKDFGKSWGGRGDSSVFSKFTDMPLKVNEYYATNPDMMIGKQVEDKLYGGRIALDGTGVNVEEELAKRIENFPEGVYEPLKARKNPTDTETAKAAFLAPPKTREGAFILHKDGKVYQNTNGEMSKLPEKEQKKAIGYTQLRDVTKEILAKQLDPSTKEEELSKLRDKLNTVYDTFVKNFGYLHSKKNSGLKLDPEFGIIAAIEKYSYDKKTKKEHSAKTKIFTERTVNAVVEVKKVNNVSDALALSLANTGKVDLEYMSKVTETDIDSIISQLGELIYQNPQTQNYETAEEYLSGNVREKLEIAEFAAKGKPEYKKNVEALKKVQPKDLEAEDISVNLGAPWIPTQDIMDFAREMLGVARRNPIDVNYVANMGTWKVTWSNEYPWIVVQAKTSVQNTSTWGTRRKSFYDLLDDILNKRTTKVYDTDPETKTRTLNQKETVLAQQKAKQIEQEFRKWIWKDKERRERLVAYYNRNFNNWKLREYDGSHLTLPGYSSVEPQLREHQKNAVWRIIQGGNTLLAHCVGAGKTWTMQTAAMELKRLGIARKSMFVIPNHMLLQFESEFRRIYPNAKLLTISSDVLPDVSMPNSKKMKPEELAKKKAEKNAKRQEILGKIATEDWDGIIISHNMFKRIPLSAEETNRFIQQQIDDMRAAIIELSSSQDTGSKRLVKELEKKAMNLEAKIARNINEGNKDIAIPFEQLGIDQIFVDEADMFKNLGFSTKMTNISGMANTDSQRSMDMYMKTQYISRTNGGRGVCFATGTPISNTMAEMFTMLRYLDGESLSANGISFFDNWAATFTLRETTVERSPDGSGYRQTEKFTKFVNAPELIKMFRKVADVKTQDELHLDIPKVKNGKPTVVEIEPNEALTNYIKNVISERADRIHNRTVDPSEDNMLKLTGDLRKASLDMRLVDPKVPAGVASGKIKAIVDRMYAKYVETQDITGVQVAFCDLSTPKGTSEKANDNDSENSAEEFEDIPEENINVYDEIRKGLIKKGIPAEQIAFVHEAKNKEQKEQLFSRVREGSVRIIIGSTEKMGAGTNFQNKLVALHDIDCPWRPRDIEQRHGRILRQGNENKEVEIFSYVTKDSYDANMWEKIKNKATMINQAMSNNLTSREIEDVGADVVSFAEIEALASGNPLMAERVMVNAELNKYEVLRADYLKNKTQNERLVESLPKTVQYYQAKLDIAKKDNAQVVDLTKENFAMTIKGKKYTKYGDAKEAFESLIASMRKSGTTEVGKLGPFDVKVRYFEAGETTERNGMVYTAREDEIVAYLVNNGTYECDASLQSMVYKAMHGPENDVGHQEKLLEKATKELEERKKQLAEPFEYEEKYQKVKARSQEIDKLLGIGEANAELQSIKNTMFPQDETLHEDGMYGVIVNAFALGPENERLQIINEEAKKHGGVAYNEKSDGWSSFKFANKEDAERFRMGGAEIVQNGHSTIEARVNTIQAKVENQVSKVSKSDKAKAKAIISLIQNAGIEVVTDKAAMEKILGGDLLTVSEKPIKTVQFLKTAKGEVYGFEKNGKIYVDPDLLNPNTPVHEYTHLWDRVCMKRNPKLWAKGKSIMKQLPLWNEVKENPSYASISNNEDLLASEVHARLTGNKAAQVLSNLEDTTPKGIIAKLKDWLKGFWYFTRDVFGLNDKEIKNITLEDWENLPMVSMLKGDKLNEALKTTDDSISLDTHNKAIDEVRAKYQGTDKWMKAPNGKPTNLTENQWLTVRTPNFKKWFGDWENDPANASKVVDENGEPLVMYHGTGADFTVFDTSPTGENRQNYTKYATGDYQEGVMFFVNKRKAAEPYAYSVDGYDEKLGIHKFKKGKVMQVFLNIRNPIEHNLKGEKNLVRAIDDNGLTWESEDGEILVKNNEGLVYATTMNANAIKSAIANNGDFSTTNNDINYQIEPINGKYVSDLKRAAEKILPIKTEKVYRETQNEYDSHAKVGLIHNNGDSTTLAGIVGMYLDREQGITRANKSARSEILAKAISNAQASLSPEDLSKFYGLSEAAKIKRGVAAFMRLYSRDKDEAQKEYPIYYSAFEKMLNLPRNRALKDKVDNFVDTVQKFEGMTEEGKARASKSKPKAKPTLWDKIKNALGYSKWFDDKDSINDFTKKYIEATHKAIADEDNPYYQARLASTTVTNRVTAMLAGPQGNQSRDVLWKMLNSFYGNVMKNKVFFSDVISKANELNAKMEGNSLEAKKLRNYLTNHNFRDWNDALGTYLLANRFLEIWKTKPFYTASMTQAQAKRMVDFAPKEIKEAAELYYKFDEDLLRIMKHDGLLSKEAYDALTQYKAYCPLFRDFADDEAYDKYMEKLGDRNGFANISNGIKYLTEGGSDRTVMDDPVISMMRMTGAIISKCERNKVGQKLVALTKASGIGEFAMPAYDAEGKQLHSPNAQESRFTVYEDGVKNAYRTTPELYKALTGNIDYGELVTNLVEFLSIPSKGLRFGSTSTPGFMANNALMDTATGWVFSRNSFIPVWGTLHGMYLLTKDEKTTTEYKLSGAAMGSWRYQDRTQEFETLDEMAGRDPAWYDKNKFTQLISPIHKYFMKGFNKYLELGEYVENSNRIEEYYLARKKGKSTVRAALEAKEITTDFTRGGEYGRVYNKITPFFNARLQGLDQLVRNIKERPAEIIPKMAILMLMAAIYWSRYHDEDWWKEKSNEEKMSAMFLPYKDEKGQIKMTRLPYPHELGLISSGLMIMALEKMNGDNPEIGKNFAQQIILQTSPAMMPAFFRPMIEVQANYDLYFNSPIETKKDEQFLKEARIGSTTSKVSIYSGKASKMVTDVSGGIIPQLSPKEFEHLYRGYVGDAGRILVHTLDDEQPGDQWLGMPILGPMVETVRKRFVKKGFDHPKSVDDWYNLKTELDQYNTTYLNGQKPQYMTGVNNVHKAINKINRQINAIRASNLPEDKKQELIYKLNVENSKIARIGLKTFSRYKH